MSDRAKVVCMGMDAFRLCLGLPPRNFTSAEIAAFVSARAAREVEHDKREDRERSMDALAART